MQIKSYTLGQASKATGKAKSTISEAIKRGDITAHRNTKGEYEIEPSELHRVYPIINTEEEPTTTAAPNRTEQGMSVDDVIRMKEYEIRLSSLSEKLDDRQDRIEQLEQERDQWRVQATHLIEDKRTHEERSRSSQDALMEERDLRQKIERELEDYTKQLQQQKATLTALQSSRLGRWLLRKNTKTRTPITEKP